MAETVNQPSARPTNKTLVFLAASVAANATLQVLDHYGAMDWLGTDTGMLRELLFGAFSGGIGLAAAWFKRDRGNQTNEVQALERAVIMAGAAIPPKPKGNRP